MGPLGQLGAKVNTSNFFFRSNVLDYLIAIPVFEVTYDVNKWHPHPVYDRFLTKLVYVTVRRYRNH